MSIETEASHQNPITFEKAKENFFKEVLPTLKKYLAEEGITSIQLDLLNSQALSPKVSTKLQVQIKAYEPTYLPPAEVRALVSIALKSNGCDLQLYDPKYDQSLVELMVSLHLRDQRNASSITGVSRS